MNFTANFSRNLKKHRKLAAAVTVLALSLWAWNTFGWMLQPQPGVLVEVLPESITERSVLLHFAPLPACADKIADYDIYVSGWHAGKWSELSPAKVQRLYVAPAESGPSTLSDQPQYYWRATSLGTNTYYMLEVEPVLKDGTRLARTYFEAPTPEKGEELNVQMFGAYGHDEALDTLALQVALNRVKPGGRVVLPFGHYRSGPLLLHGHCTLELQEGAVLEQVAGAPMELPYGGWPDGAAPQPPAFLNASGGSLVRIVGPGKIVSSRDAAAAGQTALIQCKDQQNIYLRDVVLEAGGLTPLSFVNCQDVLLDGVEGAE